MRGASFIRGSRFFPWPERLRLAEASEGRTTCEYIFQLLLFILRVLLIQVLSYELMTSRYLHCKKFIVPQLSVSTSSATARSNIYKPCDSLHLSCFCWWLLLPTGCLSLSMALLDRSAPHKAMLPSLFPRDISR